MTTSNPEWFNATSPLDLIPEPVDPEGRGEEMLRLVRAFMVTQGPYAGRRFGECILPWQERLVRKVFGDDIAEVSLKVGKGSGKTVLCAAIATAFVMDSARRGINTRAQVAVVAANIKSADILAAHIREGISADDHLRHEFRTYVARREIQHIASGITITVLPPQLSAAVGLRPALLLVDEIHIAALESREFSAVVDQLRRGGQNWPGFLQIGISTAPPERAEGYYTEWLRRARAIRDGKMTNPRHLAVLFEFPIREREDLDPFDRSQWWRGMPSLITEPGGQGTMTADALQAELDEAASDMEVNGPETLRKLLSQRLGIEAEDRPGGGGQTVLAEYWPAIQTDAMPEPTGQLFVALDPSAGLSDPFALLAVYKQGELTYAKAWQYLLKEGYGRAPDRLRLVYDQAKASGELSVFESEQAMRAAVFDRCRQLRDRSMGAVFGGDAAGLAGFVGEFQHRVGEYVAVPQNWQLMSALELAEGLAHDKRLLHAGQPLLTYNIMSLTTSNNRFVKLDAGASRQGVAKIDGAMALLSAVKLSAEAQPIDVAGMIG
jgi:phage terminase large subunit-like protein